MNYENGRKYSVQFQDQDGDWTTLQTWAYAADAFENMGKHIDADSNQSYRILYEEIREPEVLAYCPSPALERKSVRDRV